jgi:hypothetical protein
MMNSSSQQLIYHTCYYYSGRQAVTTGPCGSLESTDGNLEGRDNMTYAPMGSPCFSLPNHNLQPGVFDGEIRLEREVIPSI